ncbi:MAG: two-component system sensor histidine kinase/response regulator, partial [Myxococcota bacterium]
SNTQTRPRLRLATPPARATKGTVLIVEDNPINQMVAQRFVERAGYEAHVVGDGSEAVKCLVSERRPFDVVLMDCQMPVMDGLTATRSIIEALAKHERPPIIAVTASVLATDRQRCLEAGMDDFLSKPIDSKRLELLLAKYVAQAEPASSAS